jgi:signal transduction histidine kinase/ActR/RegA family two-component response regulator
MTAASPEQILVVAPRGRDAELTRALLEKHGLTVTIATSIEEVAGAVETAGCAVLTQEVLTAEHARVLAAALGHQAPWCDFPLIVLTNAGHRITDELGYVTVLERPIGSDTLIAAVRAALRARRRQYEARAAIQQRDQFLAMLGHELRNPLGAIVLASELARSGTPDQIESRLDMIARQSNHLARLVDDLLDVARVTSGKVQLRREAVDIDDVIRACIETLGERARSRGITLELATASGLVVEGDTVRLEQVVSNLLANAIKYSPRDRTVAVSSVRAGDACEIRVRDQGIGIEPAMLPRVFELFAQADGSLDRAEGGMGIGLTLVDRLVRLHGGEVRVASDGLGRGSEFIVRLPIGDRPVVTASPARPAARSDVRVRVVLVEDNPDIRDMTAALLAEIGCDVEVAADGPAGVECIVEVRPDLALVDIGLPGIDGFEVARRVRAAVAAPMLLVAVSGYSRDQDRVRATEAGFDMHLAKPLQIEALSRLVERSRLTAALVTS